MIKAKAMQDKLIAGGGMPWWALALVLFMLGSGLTIAVLVVNSSRRVDNSAPANPIALFLVLAGFAFYAVAQGAFIMIVVHAFKQSIGKGLMTLLIPFYAIYYCAKNWKETWKYLAAAITLGAISEQILAVRPEMHQRVGREWTREHYNQRKREHDKRFLKDQVAILTSLMEKRGLNHLILAGNPRAVSALHAALPKDLQSRVADSVFRSPRGQDYSEVLEEAVSTFIEIEQNESRSTVQTLHERVRRNGLAVVGIHASREAMLNGAASELVISEELPEADREELVRMATTLELPVEVCEGDELLASHGGVGCLLRYRPFDV